MITDINVKQSDSELIVSIKLEEFITSLRELPKKTAGLTLLTSRAEAHPKGYTHFIRPEKKKL